MQRGARGCLLAFQRTCSDAGGSLPRIRIRRRSRFDGGGGSRSTCLHAPPPPPPLAQHRPLPGRRGRGQPADRPSPAAVSYAWKRSLRRRRRARGRVLGLGSGSGPGAGAGAGRGSHGRRSMFWEGCSAQGNVSSFGCVFDTIRSQAHDRKGNAHARSRIRPSTHRQSNAKSNTPTARPLFSIPASTPPGTETTSRACHRRP